MNQFLIYCIMAVLMLCGIPATNAHAQSKAELDVISDQMYKEGNEYFILVKAAADNILDDGDNYSFLYNNGEVSLNDKTLTADKQQAYSHLFRSFLAAKNSTASYFSIRGILDMKKVLDPGSSFRTKRPEPVPYRQPKHDKLIAEMVKDGLVDTTAGYYINYNISQLVVNGKSLEGRMYEKYHKLFRTVAGFEPLKEGDNFSIRVSGKEKK